MAAYDNEVPHHCNVLLKCFKVDEKGEKLQTEVKVEPKKIQRKFTFSITQIV